MRLPCKDIKQNLPTNFTLEIKWLSNLKHTLNRNDPQLIQKYNNQILDQLQRGFIEPVHDPSTYQGVMHYIAHFPIFKDSHSTAMRIVYDASAKILPKALSLNDCLHSGPNIMQELQTMLLNFSSFHSGHWKSLLTNRDATRFLCFKDINKFINDTNNLIVYKFCCVLFSASPFPYLLNATIQYHLNQQGDWFSENIQNSIYMDNVVTGTDTKQETLEYYFSSRNYFKKAGLNLR